MNAIPQKHLQNWPKETKTTRETRHSCRFCCTYNVVGGGAAASAAAGGAAPPNRSAPGTASPAQTNNNLALDPTHDENRVLKEPSLEIKLPWELRTSRRCAEADLSAAAAAASAE